MGDHMVNSLNYSDTDRNRDKCKYNCQFLGDVTIVTTQAIEEGEEFIIDYWYNTESLDLKPTKKTLQIPLRKLKK